MRELILYDIAELRCYDAFAQQTMRWDDFYWSPEGITRSTRKNAHRNGLIHLSKTTNNDLSKMTDENLLGLYKLLIRQQSKMM